MPASRATFFLPVRTASNTDSLVCRYRSRNLYVYYIDPSTGEYKIVKRDNINHPMTFLRMTDTDYQRFLEHGGGTYPKPIRAEHYGDRGGRWFIRMEKLTNGELYKALKGELIRNETSPPPQRTVQYRTVASHQNPSADNEEEFDDAMKGVFREWESGDSVKWSAAYLLAQAAKQRRTGPRIWHAFRIDCALDQQLSRKSAHPTLGATN